MWHGSFYMSHSDDTLSLFIKICAKKTNSFRFKVKCDWNIPTYSVLRIIFYPLLSFHSEGFPFQKVQKDAFGINISLYIFSGSNINLVIGYSCTFCYISYVT